jgi:hypothetical protein
LLPWYFPALYASAEAIGKPSDYQRAVAESMTANFRTTKRSRKFQTRARFFSPPNNDVEHSTAPR